MAEQSITFEGFMKKVAVDKKFLGFTKSQAFDYANRHSYDEEDKSHWTPFMRGCAAVCNSEDYTVDTLKEMLDSRKKSRDPSDWREDFRYGYNYANKALSSMQSLFQTVAAQ